MAKKKAKTIVIKPTAQVRTVHQLLFEGHTYETPVRPLDDVDPVVEVAKNGLQVVGFLALDDAPENPRPGDLGHLFLWDPTDAIEALGDQQWGKPPQAVASLPHLFQLLTGQSRPADLAFGPAAAVLRAAGYAMLPLFMYRHHGLTLQTTPFEGAAADRPDGCIFLTPEEAAKTPNAEAALQAAVQRYGNYLSGNAVMAVALIYDAADRLISKPEISATQYDIREALEALAEHTNIVAQPQPKSAVHYLAFLLPATTGKALAKSTRMPVLGSDGQPLDSKDPVALRKAALAVLRKRQQLKTSEPNRVLIVGTDGSMY